MRNGDSRICHLCGRLHSRRQPAKVELLDSDVSALIPEAGNSRLVFVNGFMHRTVSGCRLPDGVVVSNLAGLPITHRSRTELSLLRSTGIVHCPIWADGCGGGLGARIWWLRHRFICYSFLLLVRCPRFPSRAVWWWLSLVVRDAD